MPLRSGGNARAHARALPPPPPPAPVGRGRGRIRDWCCVCSPLLGLGVPRFGGRGCALFGGLDVHGLQFAALVLLEVVGDALVLAQSAHSGALHGGDVNERVLAALVGLDETIALVLIEKFYGACWHFTISFCAGPSVDPLRC